jgi:hypothetical protein
MKKRTHWDDINVGRMIILKWNLEKYDGVMSNGVMWIRIGTSGGLS